MAKVGRRAKAAGYAVLLRRGLVLAAFTLLAVACICKLVATNTAGVDEPDELVRLPDGDLETRLRSMIRGGAAELTKVIASLGAEPEAVRRAALRSLHQEIDNCSRAATAENAEQLDRIAGLLAAQSGEFNADALSSAAALAERITALPTRAGSGLERLRNCHAVLAAEALRRLRGGARSWQGDEPGKPAADDEKAAAAAERSDRVRVVFAPLAGGSLAITPRDTEPRRFSEQIIGQSQPLHVSDALARTTKNLVQSTAEQAFGERTIVAKQAANEAAVDENTTGRYTDESTKPLTCSDARTSIPRDLARLLELDRDRRGNDVSRSELARHDILRMSIDETQLTIARGAVDDDPKVRRTVVEALATIGSVDSRSWLLWLSHDRDADVRRAAITLLATSSDPAIQKRVREAADSDADSRVREQARAAMRLIQ